VLQGGCFCCLCRPPTEQLGLSLPSTGAGEISLPNLTQDQLQAVEEQLKRARRLGGDEHAFRVLDHSALLCKDVARLTPGCWLCDNVIDVYFLGLEKRATGRRVAAFSSHLYTKLMGMKLAEDDFARGVYLYSRIDNWVARKEKITKTGIMANDLVLVPINVDQHWALVCIDVRARVITYLDSFVGLRGGHEKGEAVLQIMMAFLSDAGGLTVSHMSRWRSVAARHDVPQQENGDDSSPFCGIFTSVFGRYIARGEKLAFKAINSKAMRQLIAFELMTGSLI
jgi:Ulp1 family protease